MNLKNLALINNISGEQKPLDDDKQHQLIDLINQLDAPQSLWLSGYLAARADVQTWTNNDLPSDAQAFPSNTLSTQKPSEQTKLTILYGSQTGNGESIAQQLQQQAQSEGITTEIFSLADFTVKQLSKKTIVTLVVSTHGEGEAPDDAELFYEQLFSKKAPDLSQLKYSVLALGDTSYELFCQTGQEIDQRLKALGAEQIHQRVDCDVDFESTASNWINDVLPEVKTQIDVVDTTGNITALPIQSTANKTAKSIINKHNPYQSEIQAIQKITARDSSKNTYHIELLIDPELIRYQPGDSVGIIANNNEETVQQILTHWQLSGTETFTFKDHSLPLKKLLTECIEITQLSKPFIQFLASQIENPELHDLAESHASFINYCNDNQLLDLLQAYDPQRSIPVQDILSNLKSITPRLYSIASSQEAIDDEVHLTINLEPATSTGYHGLASGLLCNQAQVGDEVAIYIEPNNNFRLPENPDTPVIMIGPGTGVAPFRAFLQDRQASSATGDNWLFFGNPNFSSDFLYQTEWLKLKKTGVLNQISVAFSRDQSHKIYVQDKLKEKAVEIWDWIEKKAHIYLCGDANNMAKDVEQTLITIISEQGQLTPDEAKAYLKTLKRNNRYQKDVY